MSDTSRAEHWRQRAEELRTMAEGMRTQDARETLSQHAVELDVMAERLERRKQSEAKTEPRVQSAPPRRVLPCAPSPIRPRPTLALARPGCSPMRTATRLRTSRGQRTPCGHKAARSAQLFWHLSDLLKQWCKLARPERFELPTPRSVVWCSIQLSYGRMRRENRGGGGS